jgi:hypothetical protein
MNPIYLTLAFCWGLGSGICDAVPAPRPYTSEATCARDARPLAAAWLRYHDRQWRLVGWTCGPGIGDDV